ncbi:hypothetical protein [Actinophytocola oryzae]|uniref:Uncharacterized protein n=1 Tax=Actinophytocola oryzae TaxID=502181 RepID=A0A4R7UUL7_9PSEU|nr:hypothetical protein [Actinophytocola oryzae]TDV40388.1 hypothetical protein CLV71_12398 [Actinophytocola oryzae]
MSWDDFTACAGQDGQILYEAGEDAVTQFKEIWDNLPDTIKNMIIAAAEWGGALLTRALAAAGVAAAEAIAAAAAGAGLGTLIAIIYDCYDKL